MEDMARLAVLEQSLKDSETFGKTMLKLLNYIRSIVDFPLESGARIIKSDTLKEFLTVEAFTDYLRYIGFTVIDNEIVFPMDHSLDKLKIAQASIERKLHFSCDAKNKLSVKPSNSKTDIKKYKLTPSNVLRTKNNFLLKLESLFNFVLQYEDDELQETARSLIPIYTLHLKAMDRMREHAKKIKQGETKSHDLSFDRSLLMELIGWFKYNFFSWVDKPKCEVCGADTVFQHTVQTRTETETCRLEIYQCTVCAGGAKFPRYNDVAALLQSRRGRCGEWANCFTLMARALHYDVRYIYDTTDHVWCEVFDICSKSWIHVDPCEGSLNSPLVYEHGWGKKLEYVLAVSSDDIQDVTWRYSSNHVEVRKRRHLCSESELIEALLTLRADRQSQVSEPRRKYLIRRALEELVQMMVEKKPSDFESQGRISGSKEWRLNRGELGKHAPHTFQIDAPGELKVQYCAALDRYTVFHDGLEKETIDEWWKGVYESHHVFRKEEKDWNMTYLAREEGSYSGSLRWDFSVGAGAGASVACVCVRANTKTYHSGRIVWTVRFDHGDIILVEFNESPMELMVKCRTVSIRAELTGGSGQHGWQHAQLFRQHSGSDQVAFEVVLKCHKE